MYSIKVPRPCSLEGEGGPIPGIHGTMGMDTEVIKKLSALPHGSLKELTM